ncbi:hypothetical protein BDV34DRAFT_160056 [Aspergillus parasiticus]|uniref:Uncharacterized protein n=1 Tax=Aspergillus parasiticus TaxID=5067 RepID=A0A5N6DCB4_ASPPA|nr:hypothetical protein BDV34DRAFT_160056 [Aspergillus parasiticus]
MELCRITHQGVSVFEPHDLYDVYDCDAKRKGCAFLLDEFQFSRYIQFTIFWILFSLLRLHLLVYPVLRSCVFENFFREAYHYCVGVAH